MSQRPKTASLMLTETVNEQAKLLRDNGCVVVIDRDAGTVVAKDGDEYVFKAIQKGRGQPWIGMFFETDRVKWNPTNGEPAP